MSLLLIECTLPHSNSRELGSPWKLPDGHTPLRAMHMRKIEIVRYRGNINTFIHPGVMLSKASLWIFNRHNLQGDNQRFSRQRMIEIEQGLLRQNL